MAKFTRNSTGTMSSAVLTIIDKCWGQLLADRVEQIRDSWSASSISLARWGRYIPSGEVTLDIDAHDAGGMALKVGPSGVIIASFLQEKLYGCCGISVMSSLSVAEDFRRHGLGTLLDQFSTDLARVRRSGLVVATNHANTFAMNKIFRKNKWQTGFVFRSPNTGNSLRMEFQIISPMSENYLVK